MPYALIAYWLLGMAIVAVLAFFVPWRHAARAGAAAFLVGVVLMALGFGGVLGRGAPIAALALMTAGIVVAAVLVAKRGLGMMRRVAEDSHALRGAGIDPSMAARAGAALDLLEALARAEDALRANPGIDAPGGVDLSALFARARRHLQDATLDAATAQSLREAFAPGATWQREGGDAALGARVLAALEALVGRSQSPTVRR